MGSRTWRAVSTPESYCSGWPARKCSTDASKKAPDIGGLFACRGFPVVRFNALELTTVPSVCRRVNCDIGGQAEVVAAIERANVQILATRTQAVRSHLGLRISNFAPKRPSNGVSLTLCGSASTSGTDLSRPSSADSFVLCIRCLDGLPDLACGFWSRRGWTAIGASWRSRRGSAFAQAAVGVQPIGTAGMSVIYKTSRRKERA